MTFKTKKLWLGLPLAVAVGFGILAVLACGSTKPASSGPPAASVAVSAESPSAGMVTPAVEIAQPVDPADYPAAIQRYLDAGGDVVALEAALAGWGTLPGAPGQVVAADLTGDDDPEIVVALQYVGEAVAPSGDLLIFSRQAGGWALLYQEGYDPSSPAVRLLPVLDANGDGRQDIVYTLITCGAHTCFESLQILSWRGTGFFSLMGGRLDMPHPTYTVAPGRIDAGSGSVASVGAEPQRGYSEVWEWNGDVFTVTQQIWEPPVYRYHALLDGDRALLSGDYATAVTTYERVIGDDALQEWGAVSGGDPGVERAQLAAFARWRLVLTRVRSGDLGGAQSAYDRLQAEHPDGAVGHDVAALAEVFWGAYAADGSVIDGCTALVVAAKEHTSVHDFFNENYGYANPRWEAVDICPFIE